jgi:hypothetical protein
MSKKQSKQSKQLKIMGATIQRPAPVYEAEAARGVQEQLRLAVEVENPSDKPLHVWASRRAYDYDATTHVLTLYLTEHTPELPPGITIISNHPRTPVQVEVGAKSRATLDVAVPTIIRRRVPGEGLGMSFVEEPIGPIDRVDLHIQSASERVEYLVGESPAEYRARLRTHGDVVQATITPTETKEN